MEDDNELTTGLARKGRKPIGPRRTIAVPDEQWAHWQRWAVENHESVSAMLRRLADRETGWKQPANDA